jgi:hypothetical protein
VAHPGAGPDLAIAERAHFDQVAHRREGGVGVRPARSAWARRDHGVGLIFRGPEAEPYRRRMKGNKAPHSAEYKPNLSASQGDFTAAYPGRRQNPSGSSGIRCLLPGSGR